MTGPKEAGQVTSSLRDTTERMTWGVGLLLVALAIAIMLLGQPAFGVVLIIGTVLAMLFVLTDRDAATILTLFLVVLLLLPARFVVGPLGAIGTPARLMGLAALVWWLASRLNRDIGGAYGQQPLRAPVLAFSWWLLLSYSFAQLRELDPVEAGAADRRAIVTVALAGIALLAMDGLPNRHRLELLLRRMVALGGVVAIIGLLQFFGTDLVAQFRLPGLSLNSDIETVTGFRGGLPRVNSTTVHAIEFAVIMALLLPFALHFALYGVKRKWLARLWALAIMLSLPVSVSRSSIVAVAIGLPVLMAVWGWRRRFVFIGAFALALGGLTALVDGLLETIVGLFVSTDEDLSIQTRIDDYDRIYAYVEQSPIIGRGAGTFEPTVYFFLDNQWLMTTVTSGIVGLVLLLTVFVVTASCARGVVKRATDEPTRHLAQAYLAAMATFLVTFGVFDAFGFGIHAGLFYLVVGTAGALWRIEVGYSYADRDVRGRIQLGNDAGPAVSVEPGSSR